MNQWGFYFDQTRCTGCYTCAVACKDWHDLPAGPVNWLRIKAIEEGDFPNLFVAYLAQACHHCQNPPCLKVCPVQAITKRPENGLVVVDRDKCLGNRECPASCLKACPWHAPQFGPEPGAKMQKCDLCLERLDQGRQPVCVEACPMYALEVGLLSDLEARYGKQVEAAGFSYRAKIGPSVIFKAKPRPPGIG